MDQRLADPWKRPAGRENTMPPCDSSGGIGVLFLCACSAVPPEDPVPLRPHPQSAPGERVTPDVPFPVPDWPTADPAQAGLDPAKRDEAATIAEQNGSYCLLVIRGGAIVRHKARWQAEQVLPPGWVAEALTPSQAMNRDYGLLFWLNGEAPAINAMNDPWPVRMVPFAPPDLFAARGFGNQFADVIGSLDLLVVRFGKDPLTGNLTDLVSDSRFEKHDAILRPILDAVR